MIIDELFEGPQQCPECGGISFSDLILAEKKDACYYKVKASAKVWPSAYASGRLVQCRKKGAANYGNKSESVEEDISRRGFLKGAGAAAAAGAAGYKLGQNDAETNTSPYTADTLSSEDLKAIDTFLTWYAVAKRHGKPSSIRPSDINFDVDLELGTVKDLIKVYGKDFIFARLKKIQDRVFAMSDQELEKEFNRVWKGPADASKQAYINNVLLPDNKLNNEDFQQGMAESMDPDQQGRLNELIDDYNLSMKERSYWEADSILDKITREFGKDIADQVDQQGVAEMDNRTPSGDRREKRNNSPEEKTRQHKEQQQRLKDTSPKMRKKLRLPEPKQGMSEGGNVFMPNIQNTPEYKAGFATGKLPVPHPEGTQQYANYYKGVIDKASPTLSKVGEGEQQKGADYRDPKEVDYDDEYDAMVARVKRLAGLGPMKTVYDPNKRVYRNMPTAQQPKK